MEVGEQMEILQSIIQLLRVHGVWPKEGGRTSDKLFILRAIFILHFDGIMSAGCIMHATHTFRSGANYMLADILEDFAICASGVGLYFTIVRFFVVNSKITDIMSDLKDFAKFGKPPNVEDINRKANLFAKCFCAYSIGGVITYASFGPMNYGECERENAEHNVERICGLMTPAWFPFELKRPQRILLLFLQTSSAISICNSGILFQSLVVGMVEIFITKINHLKALLSRTFQIEDCDERKEHLKMCIKYHIKIIGISDKLNATLGTTFFLNLTFTSLIISIIGFQFLIKPSADVLFHVLGWILMLFIPCFAGQRLIDETTTIPNAIYSTEWFDGDIEIQKDVLLRCIQSVAMEGEDKMEILQVIQGLLRFLGIWPKKGGKVSDILFILKVVLALFLGSFIFIGSILHVAHTFITGANYIRGDIHQDLSLVVSGLGMYITIILFLTKCSKITEILEELSDFNEFGKPPTIEKVNRNMNIFTYVVVIYSPIAIVAFAILQLLRMKQCKEEALQQNVEKVCGLITAAWMPFDITEFPRFHIFLLIQVMTALLITSIICLLQCFLYIVVEIFIPKITHLKELFLQTFNLQNDKEAKDHLKMCVKYHIQIIKISEKINDCLGKIFFMHVASSSVIISVLGFQVIMDHSLDSFVQCFAWTLSLLMSCYAGQRLIDESETIPLSIYSAAWYRGDLAIQKDILFIIMRGNNNLFLDANGFGMMSLATFSAVMQTAYSYLTLLHQSYKE